MNLFKTKTFSLLASLILILSFFVPTVHAQDDNTTWEPLNPGIKDEQTDENDGGMVVSAHPLASKAGAEVLENGGNAADAAVAMQFALNVVEPMMSGIGGGGFMLYYDADSKETSIVNSRERAPAKATGDLFYEDGELPSFQDRVRSGKSVGVPGTLKGVEDALNKYGSGDYSLGELMQPAIKLAEGHQINWNLAAAIENNKDKLSKTAAGEVFLDNDGEPLKEGELLVQSDLANTFKMIAEQGTDIFYKGEIGEAIAEEVQNFGGVMEASDLSDYELSHEEPIKGNYKGYDIVTMPPPSSGGVIMLQLLKMSEKLNLTDYDVQSADKYHLLAESMHLSYADRSEYMGDPDEVDIPVEGLLEDDYIDSRVQLIDPDNANDDVKAGVPNGVDEDASEPVSVETKAYDADREEGETTHFSVVDQWGNMVSYTTTIEQVFGSGIMVDGYGFMLNNEMTDFDAEPGGANEVTAHRRPLSSMTPTIILKDDEPYMTVGSPGGMTIITSVTQTIMNAIGYDMDLKDAIEEPRIYSNLYPDIRWEIGIPDGARAEVENRGNKWEDEPVDIGNVNSIMIDREGDKEKPLYVGAADSTREGSAIGIESPSSSPSAFTDIDGHWAEEFIDEAHENGWVKGYADNTFRPENNLTRMQVTSLLVRMLELENGESVPFTDVKGMQADTLQELEAAYAANIVKGYDEKTFRPSEDVKRAHIALMIARLYEEITGLAVEPAEETVFPDISHYDEETQKAILMLKELGIVEGDNGEFHPDATTTRAQAAKMMVNFSDVLGN